jgi:mono/diheme cytochrome c family protein
VMRRAAIGAALLLVVSATSAHASVEAGETLFKARGCGGCHKVNGQGGAIGPDLSNEAAKGHDREWHIKHFLDPSGVTPGSMMPRLVKTREEAGDLADYVMSLGAEAVPAPGAASTPEAAPAPEEKTEAAPPAPAAPPKAVVEAAPPAPKPVSEPSAERGQALFRKKGCTGCHRIRGQGGSIGPDLTFEGEVAGHDADWHRRHLADPRAVTPGSTMPPFRLSEAETADLIAFLTSQVHRPEDRALSAEAKERFTALGERLEALKARVARAHAKGRNVDDLNVELSAARTRVTTVDEMIRTGNVVGAEDEIKAAEGIAQKLTEQLQDFDAQLRDRVSMAGIVVAGLLFGSFVITRKVRLLVREWDAAEGEREARRAQGRRGPLPPEPTRVEPEPTAEAPSETPPEPPEEQA